MIVSEQNTLKEIFARFQAKYVWEYSDEQFEVICNIFKEMARAWLQQEHHLHIDNPSFQSAIRTLLEKINK